MSIARLICGVIALSSLSMASPSSVRVNSVDYVLLKEILTSYYSVDPVDTQKQNSMRNNFSEMLRAIHRNRNEQANIKPIDSAKMSSLQQLESALDAMRSLNKLQDNEGLLHSMRQTVEDLEIFAPEGGGLFRSLDRTQTLAGRVVLAAMLTNPVVNPAKLEKRAAFLQALLTNPGLFKKLQAPIKQLKKYQSHLYAFWHQDQAFNALLERTLFPFGWSSSWILMPYHYGRIPVMVGMWFLAGIMLTQPTLYHYYENGKYIAKPASMRTMLQRVPQYIQTGGYYLARWEKVDVTTDPAKGMIKGDATDQTPAWTPMVAAAAAAAYGLHSSSDLWALLKYVHRRGVALSALLNAAKELQDVVKSSPEAMAYLRRKTAYARIEADPASLSDNFKAVYHTLTTASVYTNPSKPRLLASVGTVLSMDQQIRIAKDEFAELFDMVGEIDAHLSIATLVQSHGKKPVHFSLTKFRIEAEPRLTLQRFWHPAVSPDKAVANVLDMNNGFHGMILTGSNAGGKSTALKSMLMSILLGQAWGISPADSAEMTPFSFIGSFMNIKDELAENTSLFQAEMKRATELIAISKDVAQKDELRGIVVMDELFTGTSPEAGAIGTEKVARKLFLNKNLITLFATHHKDMVRLPETAELKGQVKNFRMEIYFNDKGRPIPTYRLEEGISEAQIARYYFKRDL